MHWLAAAASRAGLKGAEVLSIPAGTTLVDAWDMAARALGVTPPELAGALAPAFALAVADFDTQDERARTLLPERIARQHHVFPLREDDRHLVVATCDPTNIEVEHAIGFAAGRRAVFELATPTQIQDAFDAAYASTNSLAELTE